MANGQLGGVLGYIRQLVGAQGAGNQTDGELLDAFAGRQEAAAFESLVRRYAPLVWGVCRRVLRDEQEAEDAFQGTFLVLVRRAAALDRRGSLANWLYTVAYHLALKARMKTARRREREREAADMLPTHELAPEGNPGELNAVLDEEISRLPAKYRGPLVLCYLQGRTNEEAARELGWPMGSMSRHLTRARELLRERLTHRGIALSAGLVAGALGQSVQAAPEAVIRTTINAGMLYAAGNVAAAGLSARAVGLAEGFLHTKVAQLKLVAALLVAVSVLGGGTVFAYRNLTRESPPAPPATHSPVIVPDDGGLAVAVEQRVRDWQPTPAERRMDEIGWARDLRDAQQLAWASSRPVFIYIHSGHMATGRCCGGASHMRASGLSNSRAIELLNRYFVPLYLSGSDYGSKDGPVPKEESAELRRIIHEIHQNKLASGTTLAVVLSADGHPIDTMAGCTAAECGKLIDLLERNVRNLDVSEGPPLVSPTPQSRPPQAGADTLVLHLTARYLKRQGNQLVPIQMVLGENKSYGWNCYPAEDWLVLERTEWKKLLPAESVRPGGTWKIDGALAERLLSRFYPQAEEDGKPRTRVDYAGLEATVVFAEANRIRARLEGTVRLKQPFYPDRDDDRFVDATVQGYMDLDPAGNRPPVLRLTTTTATYGPEPFGAALRSLP